MWKKMLVGIPQGFIKITVIYKKKPGIFTEFRRNFSWNSVRVFPRNSAEHRIHRNFIPLEKFHGIPRNFSRNAAEFNGIFQTEFLWNSEILYEKFDGNIIPPEFFLTE